MIERKPPLTLHTLIYAYPLFFSHYRYKILRGGRGSAKSTQMALAIILICLGFSPTFDDDGDLIEIRYNQSRLTTIMCVREDKADVDNSLHKLYRRLIRDLDFLDFFHITKYTITCIPTGSTITYMGFSEEWLDKLRGIEGVDIFVIEEAEKLTLSTLEALTPSVRDHGSEIWACYNPRDPESAINHFCDNAIATNDPDFFIRHVNYDENPFFTSALEKDRLRCLKDKSPEVYAHIWLGHYLINSERLIFSNAWKIEDFVEDEKSFKLFGLDWGFSKDPLAIVKCYVKDECLYIVDELYEYQLDIDNFESTILKKFPDIKKYQINADSAQPNQIRYLANRGFNIKGVKKDQGKKGYIVDGIMFMRGFKKIIVHSRCKNYIHELCTYSYKINKYTNKPTELIAKNQKDHLMDCTRYAIEDLIRLKSYNPAVLASQMIQATNKYSYGYY